MDWREAQQIYLPSLNMSVGQAWNRLKKLWKSYKIAGRNGESRSLQAYEIVRYQSALDLPRADLPELEEIGITEDEFNQEDEWSDMDEQLRREEQIEKNDDWDSPSDNEFEWSDWQDN
jgi:hypothetical protein